MVWCSINQRDKFSVTYGGSWVAVNREGLPKFMGYESELTRFLYHKRIITRY
jgi:hypothetical protein